MKVRVASAGTGKTTSLVRRYLELIEQGVALRRIAGVTFTRAAADELKQRVAAGISEVVSVGSYLGGLFVPAEGKLDLFVTAERELSGALLNTIHGFMARCLRLNAPLLGLDPAFSVLGEWEAEALFAEELNALRLLAELAGDRPLVALDRSKLDQAEALALSLFAKRSLAEVLSFAEEELDRTVGALFTEAYRRMVARVGAFALGPGELERLALLMLRSPRARQRLAQRFAVALVDEYQDVNPLQGSFFERLAEAGVSLELVGDPKQSIYLFRAADVSVFRRAMRAAQAQGGLLEPLRHTRRHAHALVVFLNRLTGHLAAAGLGFGPEEAPEVVGDGPQAEVAGAVEVHLVEGDEALAKLREREAELLAELLTRVNREQGIAFERMAVIARSHARLEDALRALRAASVNGLMLRGRGFYWRSEIRDVYHALRVGVDPSGPSLAPFLRGPFGGLGLAELQAVLQHPDPNAELARRHPEVAERLGQLNRMARLAPMDALRQVTGSPIIGGRRLLELLGPRQRDNVDALLFEIAAQPPGDLELLLERLDLLAEQTDQAEVPRNSSGVRLLTVHASKGLEFEVVALFDAGAGKVVRPQQVLVEPTAGSVTLHASGVDEEAQRAHQAREEDESYRLLYVAASRARDRLIVTGSVRSGKPNGWAKVLGELGLESPPGLAGVSLTRHGFRPAAARGPDATAEVEDLALGLEPAAWTDRRFPHHPFEPLSSPSRLVALGRAVSGSSGEGPGGGPVSDASGGELPESPSGPPLDEEPLGHAAQVGGEDEVAFADLPGRGRVVGTLVHYAISRDWAELGAAELANLRGQEAMFPYTPAQREAIMAEVAELLAGYQRLLGVKIPALAARRVDRAEVPLAVRGGATVWEGVLDRLYRLGDEWVVEDYKTDRRVAPEHYHLQLGLYLLAVRSALGVGARGRLVYLRTGSVIEPGEAELTAALRAAGFLATA